MWMNKLIALGKKKTFLTHGDINRYLPVETTAAELDELLDRLEELHIRVLDDGQPLAVDLSPDDG